MSASTSRLSYSDCYELFEAAQLDGVGARRKFPDWAAANAYRLRMNTARALDRKDNAATYQIDHPLHGRSPFDEYGLTIRQIDGEWYLYIKKHADDEFKNSIEPLSKVTAPWPQPSPEPSSTSGDELEIAKSESASPSTISPGSSTNSTGLRKRLLS